MHEGVQQGAFLSVKYTPLGAAKRNGRPQAAAECETKVLDGSKTKMLHNKFFQLSKHPIQAKDFNAEHYAYMWRFFDDIFTTL